MQLGEKSIILLKCSVLMFSFLKTLTKIEYRNKVKTFINHISFLTLQFIELEYLIQIQFIHKKSNECDARLNS